MCAAIGVIINDDDDDNNVRAHLFQWKELAK